MTSFQRGQKSKLSALTPSTQVTVGIALQGAGATYDISCFGLDPSGQLSDDRYFVFYNQTASPEGAIRLEATPWPGDTATFQVDLAQLPATIEKLTFTAAIDGGATMSGVQQGYLRVTAGGNEVMRYSFDGSQFGPEKALMIGELYKKGEWRVAAVGQGFAGGLSALLAHFGGEEAGGGAPAPQPPASQPPAPQPPAPQPPAPQPPAPQPPAPQPPAPGGFGGPQGGQQPPPPSPGGFGGQQPPPPAQPGPPAGAPPPVAGPKVNLGKVTLEKSGESRAVSLRKDGGQQPIHVNLNWNQQSNQRRGFLSGLSGGSAPDLDLGCMFEMASGEKGVIQPLGGNFGNASQKPWIHLDKDDRTGAAADGENLVIYRPDQVRRVLLFALIYEGAKDFGSVGGRLTLRDQQGNETEMFLNNPDSNRTFCAIAMVTQDGNNIFITKEERYFQGHRDADGHYRFGFNWKAGRK